MKKQKYLFEELITEVEDISDKRLLKAIRYYDEYDCFMEIN